MAQLQLFIRNRPGAVFDALQRAFQHDADVTVAAGDIFAGPDADAVISPANSFGFMDGGIDLVYSQFWGWEPEERLRKRIDAEFEGELPVGCALIVPTDHPRFPWLISAPTMRVPQNVADTANAYLALRAALIAVNRHNRSGATPIRSVLSPGLCTGNGFMPPARAARQMRTAWGEVVHGEGDRLGGLAGAVRRHMRLVE